MSIVIIITPPVEPPPPPPGGRLVQAETGELIAVFDGPDAAKEARKYLKALE